jgi:hypothetical protein
MGYNLDEILFIKDMHGYQKEHPLISTEFHINNSFIHYATSRRFDGDTIKKRVFDNLFLRILK